MIGGGSAFVSPTTPNQPRAAGRHEARRLHLDVRLRISISVRRVTFELPDKKAAHHKHKRYECSCDVLVFRAAAENGRQPEERR